MRLISATHVALALIWAIHAIPTSIQTQEISSPPLVGETGDRLTTILVDLPTPQRRNKPDAETIVSNEQQRGRQGESFLCVVC
ncbi:hypothetical protein C8R46DRAFT_1226518 [Mycena filopes]|nr:hypothetical protein C8R46DRAFT_1226518 [Mycena filopes]